MGSTGISANQAAPVVFFFHFALNTSAKILVNRASPVRAGSVYEIHLPKVKRHLGNLNHPFSCNWPLTGPAESACIIDPVVTSSKIFNHCGD